MLGEQANGHLAGMQIRSILDAALIWQYELTRAVSGEGVQGRVQVQQE